MVVFDHIRKTIVVVAIARLDRDRAATPRAAYDDACRRVDELVAQLAVADGRPAARRHRHRRRRRQIAYRVELHAARSTRRPSRKCAEYIKAGDIFQVVLSQRLAARDDAPPFDIYRTLRVVNPSPFMFYLRTPGGDAHRQLAGDHGPRRGRRGHDPPAGRHPPPRRRPRTRTARLAEELLADPKERAEHIMLVDLGRNDVGRVAALRHGRARPT